MISRRDVLFGGSALAATAFAPVTAIADDARGGKTNLAEEMVRHADWFIHGEDFTAADLQPDTNLESWSAEEIAGAFAISWDHLQEHGNEAVAQVIDDYKNNDGRRFYDAFIKENGRTAQSVPTFIRNMVNTDAVKAANSVIQGNGLGRDYDKVFDKKLQAVILNLRDGVITPEEFSAYQARAEEKWREGFELFKTHILIPTLQGRPPQPLVGSSPTLEL